MADVSDDLRGRPDARAYWSTLRELPVGYNADSTPSLSTELLADVALEFEQIINRRKVRDWTHNVDVQNRMRNDIEDYLYDLRDRAGVTMPAAATVFWTRSWSSPSSATGQHEAA